MTRIFVLLLILAIPLLNGCTTLKATDDPLIQTSSDPIEGLNRGIYAFNDGTDRLILRPIAKTYDAVVPTPAKQGVSNFFSNLAEPLNIVNNLLQGKWERSLSSTYRLAVNSTVGLLGLVDVASKYDVAPAREDLGQTLASWGVGPGPYIMLPFIGPTTLRDGIGRGATTAVYYPNNNFSDDSGKNVAVTALEIIDLRASLLGADELLQRQVDPYLFLKNAYDQNRLKVIYDDNPPESKEDFDF